MNLCHINHVHTIEHTIVHGVGRSSTPKKSLSYTCVDICMCHTLARSVLEPLYYYTEHFSSLFVLPKKGLEGTMLTK